VTSIISHRCCHLVSSSCARHRVEGQHKLCCKTTYPTVVVWGATGFTGRLVCEHLVRSYADKDVRWAMAGRNKERLEQVKDSLSRINPDATKVRQT
jgi:hypothetical protein